MNEELIKEFIKLKKRENVISNSLSLDEAMELFYRLTEEGLIS